MQLPNYDELQNILDRVESVFSPAEAHGILCGMLVVDLSVPQDRFTNLVEEEAESGDVLATEADADLLNLFKTTRLQLQDPALGLEMALPEDDTDLEERIDAACAWARGVAFGVSAMGIAENTELPENTAEFLVDCRRLGSAQFAVEDDKDQNEAIYLDLVEYLRMGILLAQEELQPVKEAPKLH